MADLFAHLFDSEENEEKKKSPDKKSLKESEKAPIKTADEEYPIDNNTEAGDDMLPETEPELLTKEHIESEAGISESSALASDIIDDDDAHLPGSESHISEPEAPEELPEDERIEKLYFSIGEVAEQFDVAPSLLRFWEKEFPMLTPRKNSKGTRFYTKENIETIRTIHHLVKERGYTLQGAREKLKSLKKTGGKLEVIETLKNIRSLLLEIKGGLDNEPEEN